MDDGDRTWVAYNDAQVGRAVRPLCRAVLDHAGVGAGRLAVDLGAGAGVESAAMVEAGWRVLAIDGEADLPERIARLVPDGADVEARVAHLGDVILPPADLVHASYALPFVAPQEFGALWSRIREALAPGAWLAVDLFGDRDGWAGVDSMTFVSSLQVQDLLAGLEVVDLDEEERVARSFDEDAKHWHVFHVIARQP